MTEELLCSICKRSVEFDEQALFKLAFPEGITREDISELSMREARRLGVTIEVICSKCRE
jgi:hypothetical protein